MKRLSAFVALLAFGLSSCNSVEQFRAPIEELGGSWESITSKVADFATVLQSEQTNATALLAQMQLPEGEDFGEEATTQAQGFLSQATEHLSSITNMGATVSSFLEGWEEKSDALQDLQDGLEEGKLEGDVMATINDLKEAVSGAESNLDTWQSQLTAATGGIQSAYDSFKALFPSEEGEASE